MKFVGDPILDAAFGVLFISLAWYCIGVIHQRFWG